MVQSAVAATRERQRLPFVVPLLTLGVFLMITSEYIVAGLLQEVASDLNVSIAQVGFLITAFAVGMIIGSPVMAIATLRLPPRTTLVLALLIYAAAHVAAALSGSFTFVLVSRVITALAAGAFWAVASVVATTAAGPAGASRALGVMMSGVGLATVAGVPVGAFAGQYLGWRGIFWVLAALALIIAPVIGKLTPHDANRAIPSIRGELRAVATGRMAILVIATVLATGGYMTAFSYLSPLATERAGIPAEAIPLLFVAFGAGAVIGTNIAGRFADRRPLTTYIAATAATILLMALLIPHSASPAAMFVLMFLLGVAGMGIPPVGTGLAVRFAAAAPTLAAALAGSAFNGGTALGTWGGALTLDSEAGVLGPVWVALTLAVLALITLVIMGAMRLTKTAALPATSETTTTNGALR